MKLAISIVLFLMLVGPGTVCADLITVSGDVSGAWSADSVIVTGDVRVPPQQSLSVQSGVQVLFQGNYTLTVDSAATLAAVGVEGDSIRFDRLSYGIHWRGLRFLHASASCLLEYCQILHGERSGPWPPHNVGGGVYCDHTPITIRHCLFAECSAQGDGGAVCLLQSDALIEDNTFIENEATGNGFGGAIYAGGSSVTITGNYFLQNWVEWMYGGAVDVSAEAMVATITDNVFENNSAITVDGGGSGGALGIQGPALVSGNTFLDNIAYWIGGGIFVQAGPGVVIEGNVLTGNSARTGGGIGLDETTGDTIRHNLIYNNHAFIDLGGGNGGGISLGDAMEISVTHNTIANNSAESDAGGIKSGYDDITLSGNIVWGNSPNQIIVWYAPGTAVTYCDVQGGWSGTGNINADPLFLNPVSGDYHLTWPSPCIDAGDPAALPDPDGTRADMGAFYFDYSVFALMLEMVPTQIPVVIPASGGSFTFTATASNGGTAPLPVDFWTAVQLPDSTWLEPVLRPLRVTLNPGSTSRTRSQNVPGSAPAGNYAYMGRAGIYPNVILAEDGFPFTKLSSGDGVTVNDWFCSEETFAPNPSAAASDDLSNSEQIRTCSVCPNPFNPTTVLSFELREASYVKLDVFDVNGRNVGSGQARPLREGWMEAGRREVTFDGSGLPSGVYIYRLRAGEFNAAGKMVLIK